MKTTKIILLIITTCLFWIIGIIFFFRPFINFGAFETTFIFFHLGIGGFVAHSLRKILAQDLHQPIIGESVAEEKEREQESRSFSKLVLGIGIGLGPFLVAIVLLLALAFPLPKKE